MRITHTGTFYFDRTPRYFLEGLKRYLDAHPAARRGIVATLVGTPRDEDRRSIAELGLDDCVEVTGYLPHRDCVDITRASDALWMMIGTSDGMDVASTGKLYEYIAARKPILACVPEGAARQTLRASNAALLCDPHDVAGIAAAIERLHGQFRAGTLPSPDEEFVRQFDRRTLTGELVKIFETILHVDEIRGAAASPDSSARTTS